jgi:copper chaperone CopZ
MAGKILSILIIFITVGFAGLVYGSTKTTFQVSNLSCGSCLANIASNLQQVEGALGMEADLRQGLVVVEHDDQLAAGKIAEIITSLGYPAQIAGEEAPVGQREAAVPDQQSIKKIEEKPVQRDKDADRDVRRTSLLVKNLSCSSCLSSIEAELKKLQGPLGMSADLSRGIVWVDHLAELDCNRIAQVVTDLGYPAEVDWTAQFNRRYAMNFAAAGQGSGFSSSGDCGSGGCGLSGGGCGASSSAWKQLFNRYGNSKTK